MKVRQRETNTLCYLLYVEPNKHKTNKPKYKKKHKTDSQV